MLWVKGELLTDVDAPGVDPSGQLEREAQPFLFDRRDWFRLVARHLGAVPLIGRAASEGALCWLFLQREPRGTVSSLSNQKGFGFRPVFAGNPSAERQRAMLVAISKRLKKARPAITSLCLSPVPEGDGSASLLRAALGAAGWATFVRETSERWICRVNSRSFAEYLEARPSAVHERLRLATENPAFETHIFRQFDDDAWSTLEALLGRRHGNAEALDSFEKELAVAEGMARTVRLGLCSVDGTAVAAQLWTVENGLALIHRVAQLDGHAAATGATILTAALFRQAIDDDRVEVMEWTDDHGDQMAEWMDESAPLMRIDAFNLSSLSGFWGALKARLYGLFVR
ncbi:hypothetical protein [Aquisediminimonas profunda]|uniref:hypothetical protein n=1 Tax=Aquisediminimonas profunda TaxID=1550733 RepID=UPI001C628450|nr:hypothetical protein [Aquisediminimonas profunda]